MANVAKIQNNDSSGEVVFYETLQAAFDALKSNQTLTILAGTYEENVKWNKMPDAISNVIVQGETDGDGNNLVVWKNTVAGGKILDLSRTGKRITSGTIQNIDFIEGSSTGNGKCIILKEFDAGTIKNCSFASETVQGPYDWNPISAESGGNGVNATHILDCTFVGGTMSSRYANNPNYSVGRDYNLKVEGCSITNTCFNAQAAGDWKYVFENNNIVLDFDSLPAEREMDDASIFCAKLSQEAEAGGNQQFEIEGGSITTKGRNVEPNGGWALVARGNKQTPEATFTGVKFTLDSQNGLVYNFMDKTKKYHSAYDVPVNLNGCSFFDGEGTQITDVTEIARKMMLDVVQEEVVDTVEKGGGEVYKGDAACTVTIVQSDGTKAVVKTTETKGQNTITVTEGDVTEDYTQIVSGVTENTTFNGNVLIDKTDCTADVIVGPGASVHFGNGSAATGAIKVADNAELYVDKGGAINGKLTLAQYAEFIVDENAQIGEDALILVNEIMTDEQKATWMTQHHLSPETNVRKLKAADPTAEETATEIAITLTDVNPTQAADVTAAKAIIINSTGADTEIRGDITGQETALVTVNNNLEGAGAMAVTGTLAASDKVVINNGTQDKAAVLNGGSDKLGVKVEATNIEVNNFGHLVADFHATTSAIIHNNSDQTLTGVVEADEELTIDAQYSKGAIKEATITAGKLTLANEQSIAKSVITVTGDVKLASGANITMYADSTIIAKDISLADDTATFTINADGFEGFNKVLDLDATADLSKFTISGNVETKLDTVNGDIYVWNADTSTLKVNTAWTTYNWGDAIEDHEGYYYGINAFSDTDAAVLVAKELSSVTIDFLDTPYNYVPALPNGNEAIFKTKGTYTLTGGNNALIYRELEIGDKTATEGSIEHLVITDADLTLTKLTMRAQSSVDITESTVNFDAFENGCPYMSVNQNSKMTISNSMVGLKSTQTSHVANFVGPRFAVYGTAEVTDSTLYCGIGQGNDAIDVAGNGTLTITDSDLYMSFINIGTNFETKHFSGDNPNDTMATVILDGVDVANTQYQGDQASQYGSYGIGVGTEDAKHKGTLIAKNGTVINLTSKAFGSNMDNINVAKGSSFTLADSTIKLNKLLINNEGAMDISGTASIDANSIDGDIDVADGAVITTEQSFKGGNFNLAAGGTYAFKGTNINAASIAGGAAAGVTLTLGDAALDSASLIQADSLLIGAADQVTFAKVSNTKGDNGLYTINGVASLTAASAVAQKTADVAGTLNVGDANDMSNSFTVDALNVSATGTVNVAAGNDLYVTNLNNKGLINLALDTIAFSGTWANTGTVAFDLGASDSMNIMLIDYTGSQTMTVADYGDVTLNKTGYSLAVVNNDLYAINVSTIKVNTAWTSESVLPEGFVWGTNAFSSLETATAAAGSGSRVFEFVNAKAAKMDLTVSVTAGFPNVSITQGTTKVASFEAGGTVTKSFDIAAGQTTCITVDGDSAMYAMSAKLVEVKPNPPEGDTLTPSAEGQTVTKSGQVGYGTGVANYELVVAEGTSGVYTFNLTTTDTAYGKRDYVSFSIQNADGKTVTYGDVSTDASRTMMLTAGTYKVTVDSFDHGAGDYNSSFEVSVKADKLNGTAEAPVISAKDDSFAGEGVKTLAADSSVTDFVGLGDANDWIKLNITESGSYSLTFSAEEAETAKGAHAYLYKVEDASDAASRKDILADAVYRGESVKLDNLVLDVNASYFIKVHSPNAYTASNDASYTLALTKKAAITGVNAADDAWTTASNLAADTPITDYVGTVDECDWYKLAAIDDACKLDVTAQGGLLYADIYSCKTGSAAEPSLEQRILCRDGQAATQTFACGDGTDYYVKFSTQYGYNTTYTANIASAI